VQLLGNASRTSEPSHAYLRLPLPLAQLQLLLLWLWRLAVLLLGVANVHVWTLGVSLLLLVCTWGAALVASRRCLCMSSTVHSVLATAAGL
jgi:hypothetical protein